MANVISVNDENFQEIVLDSPVPVLVDFNATWCGPCKALSPIVHKIADENAGKLRVVTIDTDEATKVAARYGVRSVPTVVVFNRGEKRAQHVGLTSRDRLLALVAQSG